MGFYAHFREGCVALMARAIARAVHRYRHFWQTAKKILSGGYMVTQEEKQQHQREARALLEGGWPEVFSCMEI